MQPTQPTWTERLTALGTLGAVVHLVGFVVCLASMAAGIRFGLLDAWPWLAERLPGDATTLIGAYALTKVLSVPRIGVTLAVTPIVARWRTPAPVPGLPAGAARSSEPEQSPDPLAG